MTIPEMPFSFDPDNITGKYVLDDDGEPRPEPNLLTWAAFYETTNRTVFDESIGSTRISTIFLGLDYGHARLFNRQAAPVLWETMVFGSALDHMLFRYTSKLAALRGHVVVRELVERFGDPPRRLKKALKKYRVHGKVRPAEARRVRRWHARLCSYGSR